MERSVHRILTTHVGSLPRPKDLIELYQQDARDDVLMPRLKAAVTRSARTRWISGSNSQFQHLFRPLPDLKS